MTGKRNVMPKSKEILSREGLKLEIIRADDVELEEREEWFAKHGREFDVMICFPQLVSAALELFSKVQRVRDLREKTHPFANGFKYPATIGEKTIKREHACWSQCRSDAGRPDRPGRECA